jgi:hypothetical protein
MRKYPSFDKEPSWAYTSFRADHSSDSSVSLSTPYLGKMYTKYWFRLILAIEDSDDV